MFWLTRQAAGFSGNIDLASGRIMFTNPLSPTGRIFMTLQRNKCQVEGFFSSLKFWEAFCVIDLASGRIIFHYHPVGGFSCHCKRKGINAKWLDLVSSLKLLNWDYWQAFCGIALASGEILWHCQNTCQVREFCFKLEFTGRPFAQLPVSQNFLTLVRILTKCPFWSEFYTQARNFEKVHENGVKLLKIRRELGQKKIENCVNSKKEWHF